ncbi:hypothetical protein LEQ06_19445 [Paraclostridium sp. AKS46]|nr:hypothetical protein [Paraclostridium sp. AKS46]
MLGLSIIPNTVFADDLKSENQFNSDNSYDEIVNIDGQNIKYSHYDRGDLSYLTFNDGSDSIVITTNNVTGEIRLNDEYVTTRPQDNSASLNDSKISTARASWVKFNTKYSNLVSSVLSAASWAGIIASLMGVPVGLPIIAQIAKQLASDHLGIVYYIKDEYYLNPVTGSRPTTANTYKYYKNSNYTGYLGMYDGRY